MTGLSKKPMPRLNLPRRETLGAALVLTALLVLFFWRAIFLGESLLPNDLIYEFDPVWQPHAPAGFTTPGNRLLSDVVYFSYPWQVETRRALADSRVPLWTPYINGGQPMLGNGQIGVWDPFWLIARLFPLHSSFFVAAFLKLGVGGIFTYLLARELGISRRGAILAMIAFAFSGPIIVWLGYTVSGVAVWLPLLLYLSERALARPPTDPIGGRQTTAPFLAIGIVLAFQLFSGHPETSFHIMLIWAVYCVGRAIGRDGWSARSLLRLLGRMTLAVAIGLALATMQMLPVIENVLNSAILIQRQANAPASFLQTALFDWQEWPTLITTILPQFFGTPLDNSYWYPFQNYNEQTFYAGVVPLALGTIALFAWWRGRRRPAALSAKPVVPGYRSYGLWIGLTLLALGIAAQLPLFNAVNALPILRLVNNGRLRIVYALGLALLAGYGLDLVARNRPPGFNAPRKFLAVLGALAMASLIMIGGAYVGVTALRDRFIAMGRSQAEAMKSIDHPLFPYSLEYYYERVEARYEQTRLLYTPAAPQMFLPAGVALLASLLYIAHRRTGNQDVWLNGLVLLTCADLFLFGFPLNPTLPPAQSFPSTPAVDFLKQQPGLFRVGGLYLAFTPNASIVFGLSDVRGYDAVVPWRYKTLFDRVESATHIGHYGVIRSANSWLLDLMNVEYMISDRELSGRWAPVFEESDSPVRIYHNPDVMPRAFIVHQAVPAANAEAALNSLLDEGFDFRTRVILESAPADLLPDSDAPSQTGAAHVVTYEPERVVVETDTPAEGILVLTDTYDPGWHALVDGQPAEVYIADFAFRGVRIPAGRHRVEFYYTPTSFAIGAIASLAAVAFCAVWAGVILYKRAR